VPGSECVRTCPHRMAGVGGHRLAILHLVQDVGLLPFQGGGGGYRKGRQRQGLQETCEGSGEVDLDVAGGNNLAVLEDRKHWLVRIGLENTLEGDPGRLFPQVGGKRKPAVEVGANCGGIERRSIMEGYFFTELEVVAQPVVAVFPFRGEQGGSLPGGAVDAYKPLKD